MAELELTRSRADRRLYELGPLGSLRLEGFFSRRATATSAGMTWHIGHTGLFARSIHALGAGGAVVGEFDPRAFRRAGELRWSAQRFDVRPASAGRERYALAAGDHELAVFEAKAWGRRPVKVEILRPAGIDPGLMLFAAFVVRSFVDRTGNAAG